MFLWTLVFILDEAFWLSILITIYLVGMRIFIMAEVLLRIHILPFGRMMEMKQFNTKDDASKLYRIWTVCFQRDLYIRLYKYVWPDVFRTTTGWPERVSAYGSATLSREHANDLPSGTPIYSPVMNLSHSTTNHPVIREFLASTYQYLRKKRMNTH